MTSPSEVSEGEYWSHHYARHSGGHTPFLLTWLVPAPGEAAVDVGCGNGELTDALRAAGAEALGVDVSEHAVALARKTHPAIAFKKLDERPLDEQFGPERWDIITCVQVIEHIAPDQVDSFIGGLARSLRPGGRMLIDVPVTGNLSDRWLMYRNVHLRDQACPPGAIDSSLNPTHLWKIGKPAPFLARFSGYGLEIARVRELYYAPWVMSRLGYGRLVGKLPTRMLDEMLKGLTVLLRKPLAASDQEHASPERVRQFSAFWSPLPDARGLRRLRKLLA